MKKYIILAVFASMFFLSSCDSLHYGSIRKIGDRTYAMEVRADNFFGTKGAYLALCTADAAGNFKCAQGQSGNGFATLGFGAVVK